MESLKIFSTKETVIWCVVIALVSFAIVAGYIFATSKIQIDGDVKQAHMRESRQIK